jgi:hypothetical protein
LGTNMLPPLVDNIIRYFGRICLSRNVLGGGNGFVCGDHQACSRSNHARSGSRRGDRPRWSRPRLSRVCAGPYETPELSHIRSATAPPKQTQSVISVSYDSSVQTVTATGDDTLPIAINTRASNVAVNGRFRRPNASCRGTPRTSVAARGGAIKITASRLGMAGPT